MSYHYHACPKNLHIKFYVDMYFLYMLTYRSTCLGSQTSYKQTPHDASITLSLGMDRKHTSHHLVSRFWQEAHDREPLKHS
jgi:hypothetical protein